VAADRLIGRYKGDKMRIKIIRFVVKVLGYEWSGNNLKLPVWQVKEKRKKS
jgi:hypothetical protein